jgi:hypothetical protein
MSTPNRTTQTMPTITAVEILFIVLKFYTLFMLFPLYALLKTRYKGMGVLVRCFRLLPEFAEFFRFLPEFAEVFAIKKKVDLEMWMESSNFAELKRKNDKNRLHRGSYRG